MTTSGRAILDNIVQTIESLNATGSGRNLKLSDAKFHVVDELDDQALVEWESENITRRFELDIQEGAFSAIAEDCLEVEYDDVLIVRVGYDLNRSRLDLLALILEDRNLIIQKLASINFDTDNTKIYERGLRGWRKIELDISRVMVEIEFSLQTVWDSIYT